MIINNGNNGLARPRVCIVTPSYNQGRYILHTIQSVLSQDFPELEYWVIDGGSTDETIQILRSFEKDPRFHWISEPDQGQADAVNKGWKRTDAEILGWLNSDDLYLPGAVRRAMQALDQFPHSGFVYSNYEIIDEHGARRRRIRVRQANLEDQILFNCLIPQQTVFIRRSAINTVGELRTNLHYAMDQELWARVLTRYHAIYVDDCWAQQRVQPDAKTQAHWFMLYREFDDVLREYSNLTITPSDVLDEAQRRSSLNMFIVELQMDNLSKAISHLRQAIHEYDNPFASIGYCVKHVAYHLRTWNTPEIVDSMLASALQCPHIDKLGVDQRAFLRILYGYNLYQSKQYDLAYVNCCQALAESQRLRNDRYLQLLPYLTTVARPIVEIKRMLWKQ